MATKKETTAVVEKGNNPNIPKDWRDKLAEYGFDIHDASEYTGGLSKLNKDSLVGTPFVIVEIKQHDSNDFGGRFYFCHVVTEDGREGYFTDGGVGIRDTLDTFVTQTGQWGGLWCRNGLCRTFPPTVRA